MACVLVQGDKKEPHDSLLDAGLHTKDDHHLNNAATTSRISSINKTNVANSNTGRVVVEKEEAMEYTYDKAIEGYKQYAENSVKRRTSSMTSLVSDSSGSARYDDKSQFDTKDYSSGLVPTSPTKAPKIEGKLDFFVKEMDKSFTKPAAKPIVIMREKSPKVDISKRRTMFEMSQSTSTVNLVSAESKLNHRRSVDMTASTGNLKNKVASFENVELESNKSRSVTPSRDNKFREKLASFTSVGNDDAVSSRKKTPEKDKNFHQKLASFASMENDESNKSFSRKSSVPQLKTSLKSKIASFEQLDHHDQNTDFRLVESDKIREKSVSMESLSRPPTSKRFEVNVLKCASSTGNLVTGNLVTGNQTTPYIEVNLESPFINDTVHLRHANCELGGAMYPKDDNKRSTVYETVEACQLVRNVEDSQMFSIFKTDVQPAEVGDEVCHLSVAWRVSPTQSCCLLPLARAVLYTITSVEICCHIGSKLSCRGIATLYKKKGFIYPILPLNLYPNLLP